MPTVQKNLNSKNIDKIVLMKNKGYLIAIPIQVFPDPDDSALQVPDPENMVQVGHPAKITSRIQTTIIAKQFLFIYIKIFHGMSIENKFIFVQHMKVP